MELDAKIEALLLSEGKPLKILQLAKYLKEKEESINLALDSLEEKLAERGILLQRLESAVALVTVPLAAAFIENMQKEELTREIGKAGAETLAIVLYKGSVTRSEIEYIRGVNTTFTLRNLLIRGLIDRSTHPKDHRSFLYTPTFELLSFLGIRNIEELPDLDKVKHELAAFEQDITTENNAAESESGVS